jgi:diguanylate cyclase (GGDEF)-like protein
VKILASLEKQSESLIIFIGFILICIIGFVDYITGYETAFSLFYALPISLVTWVSNPRLGYTASIISAIVWLVADIASGQSYSHILIPIWNTLIRLSFFVIITSLLSSLKSSSQREKELSHTDYLTTAANSRHFYEIAQMEINRFQRYQHPFTIAYIDVDNFKSMNDQFGHAKGDLVLQTVVSSVKRKIRKTDMVARLGGDEFALFFPETDQESARIIFPKIHNALLDEMQKNNWSITFSIGVVTCKVAPHTTDELLKMADELMYSVKSDGKDSVKYSIYAG